MAPKKRGGSGARKHSKKKKTAASAADSDNDGDDREEEEPNGPSRKGTVSFGVQFMLFRVLMLAGVPVSFARSAGNVAKVLSPRPPSRGQRGPGAALMAARNAGQLHAHHFSDSRVHRCRREADGF
mgnify:CR=1 FL=1